MDKTILVLNNKYEKTGVFTVGGYSVEITVPNDDNKDITFAIYDAERRPSIETIPRSAMARLMMELGLI